MWGSPLWRVGALIAASFARTGWGTAFTGQESAQGLEPLQLVRRDLGQGQEGQLPLEEALGVQEVSAFSEAGVLALSCRRDSDQAFAPKAPSCYAAQEGELRPTTRQQLFAAQITTSLESIVHHLDPSCGLEACVQTLLAGLEMLGYGAGGSPYAVSGQPLEGVGRPRLNLRVEPRRPPLGGLQPLLIEVPLPFH